MEKKIEIVTFNPHLIHQGELERFNAPSCVNMVNVVKYKVTVEPIKETPETYRRRLQKLLDSTTNPYQIQRIRRYAALHGLKLD